jgi:hypothetical protein
MTCGSTNKSQTSSGRQIEVISDDQSCRTGLTTALSVAGGLAIGAGLMYLLDPDEGSSRRSSVASFASNAASSTGSALETGWSKLRDTAERVYDAAAEGAHTFKDKLSDTADDVADNRYVKRFSKSARSAKNEAGDRLGYLMRGRQHYGLESGISQGAAAIACLAIGVGAMYFLDPRDGARRRATFRDKFLSAFGRMATSLERQSRNISNRITGLAHDARSKFSSEEIDDQTLTDRIRATIGRYVDNAGAIDVSVIQGRCTLRGPIMASQLNGLLKATRGVRGVNGIDNQLDVRVQPQQQTGSSTASTARTSQPGAQAFQRSAPLCPPGSSTTSSVRI